MLRRAFDRFDELTAGELHHKGAIDHERNQQVAVRLSLSIDPLEGTTLVVELVEGLTQSFLRFSVPRISRKHGKWSLRFQCI
jgi:hypothetical protein